MTRGHSPASAPQVLVLLATFNGSRWIAEQLQSILDQEAVSVKVLVSDDMSSDGTLDILGRYAGDPRVTIVSQGRHGSAAANFFFLIRLAQGCTFDFLALADQDDVWHPQKLMRAVQAIRERQVAAISTNVTAFWPDGREALVRKDQAPGSLNHFFESAGPGCTYVMADGMAHALTNFVAVRMPDLVSVDFHDWMIYAWARTNGYRWWTDPWPSLRYRQHSSNALGANAGLRGKIVRWRMLRNGWYRAQVLRIATLCDAQAQPTMVRLQRLGWIDRFVLATHVRHMRRRWVDCVALAFIFLVGHKN